MPYFAAYYKNRNGALIDLDGNNVGSCQPFYEDPFRCQYYIGWVAGMRKLRCTLNVSSEDINKNLPPIKRSMRHIGK
jgi:hypothetical protein